MKQPEYFRKKIKSARDLNTVVHSMKMISMVSIHQFERAAASLSQYFDTVELGMQVIAQYALKEGFEGYNSEHEAGETGCIVVGAGQALCGPFDKQIFEYSMQLKRDSGWDATRYFVLGARLFKLFESQKPGTETSFTEVPGTLAGFTHTINTLSREVESWWDGGIRRVTIVHHKPLGQGRFHPRTQQLLPLDTHWLKRLSRKKWPGPGIPQTYLSSETLFAALIRQYLQVSFYRALAESLAAEHMSRLQAMNRAENKIEERLHILNLMYSRSRQGQINDELQDIQAGYQAVDGQW